MPPAWTRRLEEERLAEQVARCYEHAPFYRRKLEEAGARPGTSSGSRTSPGSPSRRSRSSDSRGASPPYGDFVCADPIEILRVHLSSGTTGKPLVIPYTERDLATSAELGARAFWAAVRPDDTVLHCLAYGFYTGGVSDHLALEATGATMVPVGLGQSAGLELWRELRRRALLDDHLPAPSGRGGRGAQPRPEGPMAGLSKLIVTGSPAGRSPHPPSSRRPLGRDRRRPMGSPTSGEPSRASARCVRGSLLRPGSHPGRAS